MTSSPPSEDILLVIFYEVTDFITHIYNNFKNKVHKISYFPLFLHSTDKLNKKDNYFELLNDKIKSFDYIIFICLSIEKEELKVLRKCNQDKLFILLAFDEPYCCKMNDYNDKLPYFDIIVSPLKDTDHFELLPGYNKIDDQKKINTLTKDDIRFLSYDTVNFLLSSTKELIWSDVPSLYYSLCLYHGCKVQSSYFSDKLYSWSEWCEILLIKMRENRKMSKKDILSNRQYNLTLIELSKLNNIDILLEYIEYISLSNDIHDIINA